MGFLGYRRGWFDEIRMFEPSRRVNTDFGTTIDCVYKMCSMCVGLVCVATNNGHAILQGPYSQAQINIDLTFDCFVIE